VFAGSSRRQSEAGDASRIAAADLAGAGGAVAGVAAHPAKAAIAAASAR
jgi:hypothetical protein